MNPTLDGQWAHIVAGIGPASLSALVNVLSRSDVIAGIAPDSLTALVNALKRSGALDGVLAEASTELRDDHTLRPSHGQLATAIRLVEAGAPKDVVLAKVSRRTYFRARRECQECQATPTRTDTLLPQ